MLLEPYAAGLAASHASDAQIEELERLNQSMQDAVRSAAPDRVQQVQQLNNQFHHKLLEAAQSARVRAMVENLLDMPIIIGSFYFYGDDDMLRSVEHHRQIIAAAGARRRMRRAGSALSPGGHASAVPQPPQGQGPAGGGMTRPPAHETGSRCSCPTA